MTNRNSEVWLSPLESFRKQLSRIVTLASGSLFPSNERQWIKPADDVWLSWACINSLHSSSHHGAVYFELWEMASFRCPVLFIGGWTSDTYENPFSVHVRSLFLCLGESVYQWRHHAFISAPKKESCFLKFFMSRRASFQGHTLNLGGGQTRHKKTIRSNHSKARGTQQQTVEEVTPPACPRNYSLTGVPFLHLRTGRRTK